MDDNFGFEVPPLHDDPMGQACNPVEIGIDTLMAQDFVKHGFLRVLLNTRVQKQVIWNMCDSSKTGLLPHAFVVSTVEAVMDDSGLLVWEIINCKGCKMFDIDIIKKQGNRLRPAGCINVDVNQSHEQCERATCPHQYLVPYLIDVLASFATTSALEHVSEAVQPTNGQVGVGVSGLLSISAKMLTFASKRSAVIPLSFSTHGLNVLVTLPADSSHITVGNHRTSIVHFEVLPPFNVPYITCGVGECRKLKIKAVHVNKALSQVCPHIGCCLELDSSIDRLKRLWPMAADRWEYAIIRDNTLSEEAALAKLSKVHDIFNGQSCVASSPPSESGTEPTILIQDSANNEVEHDPVNGGFRLSGEWYRDFCHPIPIHSTPDSRKWSQRRNSGYNVLRDSDGCFMWNGQYLATNDICKPTVVSTTKCPNPSCNGIGIGNFTFLDHGTFMTRTIHGPVLRPMQKAICNKCSK